MTKRAPYERLRRRYEVSLARAKLEFAESGDNDKVWPAINERQDKRNAAIFADLEELEPPEGRDEAREVLKIITMFLEDHAHLGIDRDENEFLRGLIRRATRGLINVEMAEERAEKVSP
jgi:hypothetical protein